MVTTLTDREIEALIRALKYWRSHRDPDDVRRNDPALRREEIDLLLAKLECSGVSTRSGFQRSADLFQR
jgi:hypothetical protein